MPAFITRVELHGADGKEYELLHREMQLRGFRRQVLSGDRTLYDLPSAMYRISKSDLKAATVRDLAREAAKSTGKRFWIFSAEYVSAAWVLQQTDDTDGPND